jgi:Zn-dependent M28 family amino/carboxypeptidase
VPITNSIRFAWWAAEELGLLGSTNYVNTLTPEGMYWPIKHLIRTLCLSLSLSLCRSLSLTVYYTHTHTHTHTLFQTFCCCVERSKIALNINFDMLGSPNYFRGILNGFLADPNINAGSSYIAKLFQDFFQSKDLSFIMTPFNGRSDYGPFLEAGIPAGGLKTGAEEPKTTEWRKLFGGNTNAWMDPCYHQSCDTYVGWLVGWLAGWLVGWLVD